MLITLKVLRLYNTTNRVYLKRGDGLKQELKNYSVRNTHICVIYLFRPGKLAREQRVWNVGWMDEEEGKEDTFNGCCSWCSVQFGWICNSFYVRPAALAFARVEIKQ